MSSLARVRNSGSLFQSIICNFFTGDLAAVRIIGVTARRKLTVVWNCTMGLLSLLSLAIRELKNHDDGLVDDDRK